jgi:hypothetical protein
MIRSLLCTLCVRVAIWALALAVWCTDDLNVQRVVDGHLFFLRSLIS